MYRCPKEANTFHFSRCYGQNVLWGWGHTAVLTPVLVHLSYDGGSCQPTTTEKPNVQGCICLYKPGDLYRHFTVLIITHLNLTTFN